MTDNEIIDGLACCGRYGTGCEECPYKGGSPCYEVLIDDASELVDRLQAEIERLSNKVEAVFLCHDEEIEQAEKWARAEAIKEFAEKLKKECEQDGAFGYVDAYSIDNLIKEMTGDVK